MPPMVAASAAAATSGQLIWRNDGERELVFVSNFEGGEVFRSGCVFYRGNGRIFYFSPGDQEYPVYHHPDVQRVLSNAVRWAHGHPTPALVGNKQRNWFTTC